MLDWWQKPRLITVVVDNDSWILSYAAQVVAYANAAGDSAYLARAHEEVKEGAVAFYLGCVKITPPGILARNRRNLVVHASDLPKGRGFSPWTYGVIEGRNVIPVCLIEAAEAVDSGPVIYKHNIHLNGTELVGELRAALGLATQNLCERFLAEEQPPAGIPQQGECTVYPRRTARDSQLDPAKSIAAQFDLLRTVDNEKYPAYFEFRGRRYKLTIMPHEKEDPHEKI